MSVTISKKVFVKPGVQRNVHVNESTGSAKWIVHHEGTQIAVPGIIVNNTAFLADAKFQYIVDAYVPMRKQYKATNTIINKESINKIREYNRENKKKMLLPNGEYRSVNYTSENTGSVSYKNIRIPGTVVANSFFIPRDKNDLQLFEKSL